MLDDWHEFFLASAGAAAVLLGLAYLGLSDGRERIRRDDLRAVAENTALTLGYAVIISLVMLIPAQLPWIPFLPLGAVAIIALPLALRPFGFKDGDLDLRLPKGFFNWLRYGLGLAGDLSLLAVAGGVLLSWIDLASAVQAVAGIMVAYFIIGIQDAWDLLLGGRFDQN